ncbi:hypothetical protein DX888_15580 [Vibrio alginolyticus]|nr:hypothetical protein [Vibrio alginolyticus]PNP21847.1 hypothetical protein AL471_013780 [Vibrio alginolyticus]
MTLSPFVFLIGYRAGNVPILNYLKIKSLSAVDDVVQFEKGLILKLRIKNAQRNGLLIRGVEPKEVIRAGDLVMIRFQLD